MAGGRDARRYWCFRRRSILLGRWSEREVRRPSNRCGRRAGFHERTLEEPASPRHRPHVTATALRAVVLARGLGRRMQLADDVQLSEEQRRAADAGSKTLVPVAGRPFIDFVLNALADAG